MRASRISKIGWCVGCNPPFVDCGIRLIGLPAPSGRYLIGDCLPFPPAGQPFQRFHQAHSTLRMPHRQVRVDVSFLLCCQGSRHVPEGTAVLLVGGVSSDPSRFSGSDSHTPTRQPKTNTLRRHKQQKLRHKQHKLFISCIFSPEILA